ncbi:MAG: RIP metalloprotease RseP [Candidatus Omnitrophica bacterium]|nr:RIP metalloprotease RseP [Candidatus Omnitrophota bacterium]
MLTLFIFAVVLGVLVTVHEFGHFLIAKWRKVRVETFSIGFGKKIVRIRRGETEYCVSLIPLGGYVKLAGEHPEDERKGEQWEFLSKSAAERAAIVCAGPVFNYALGFALFWLVFFAGMPTLVPQVGGFLATAEKSAVRALIADPAAGEWALFFEDPRAETLIFKENAPALIEAAALPEDSKARLRALSLTPAQAAGMETGDRVRAVDGSVVRSWDDFTAAIKKKNTGRAVRLQVDRGGARIELSVLPRVETEKNVFGDSLTVGRIGVTAADAFETVRYGFGESLRRAATQVYRLTTQTYRAFFKMITGGISAREQLLGPVGIYKFTGVIAQHGLMALLHWMGLLSVSLAIINLFPLPVLDGGHLLFLIIEQLRGRPLSVKAQEWAMKTGFAVLLMVGVFVFYNDLLRVRFFEGIAQFFQGR